jgi:mannose-6-phosphate isomerase-like protein (cupin superfamily)
MAQQIGRPILVEFFDSARINSHRTLPYMRAWNERYVDPGLLRIIGVHTPAFSFGRDPETAMQAIEAMEVPYPVVLDPDFAVWREYGNRGWPARYLFDRDLRLFDVHFGEGAYRDTEAAIQELLGVEREPVAHVHREDDPEARIVVPTADQEGAWSGPYEAGAVWAVLEGTGRISVNGRPREVAFTGAHVLIDHGRHEHGVLELEAGDGVTCHAVCFTPGLAPD